MAVLSSISSNISGFLDDTTQNTVALIETYRNFPSASPVATFLLACSGFGYTGFGDRVVCSRCGAERENWQPGEDSNLARFHKANCPNRCSNNATSSGRSAGDVLMRGMAPNSPHILASPESDDF